MKLLLLFILFIQLQAVFTTHNHLSYYQLEHILNRYQRPFKLFDITPFPFNYVEKIANDYPSLGVVMAEEEHDFSYMDNVIHLKKSPTLKKLQLLAEHEHFDLVIARNVIHKIKPTHSFQVIDSLINLGNTIIIENPVSEIDPIFRIENYLLEKDFQEIFYNNNDNSKLFVKENTPIFTNEPTFKLSLYAEFNGVYPFLNDLIKLLDYNAKITMRNI